MSLDPGDSLLIRWLRDNGLVSHADARRMRAWAAQDGNTLPSLAGLQGDGVRIARVYFLSDEPCFDVDNIAPEPATSGPWMNRRPGHARSSTGPRPS